MGIFDVCYETLLRKQAVCLLFFDCRGLVHLFCYRGLQLWSTDCRRFTSEKTTAPQ
ncbi:hypothetical protein Hanom_Chr06g00532931 [Helianthus anomalus]